MNSEAPKQSTAPAEILVLDDEKTIAELLSEMLEMLGHHTTHCLSGQEALDLIAHRHFDVILSDYRMPAMNGQEFHRLVNEKNPALAKRIVFLTGDILNDETQNFFGTIGNFHLGKPFQISELERTVKLVLSKNAH